jgi:dipeptidyl aminopeptidase/acylaminoacyl peptidase
LGVIAESAFANMRTGFRHSPSCDVRWLFDNPICYKLLQYFGAIYIHNIFGNFIDPTAKTNALSVVQNVRNLFIIHGKEDKVIPVENAHLLINKAKKRSEGIKEIWVYQGGHVEAFLKHPGEYKKKIVAFIKQIMEG